MDLLVTCLAKGGACFSCLGAVVVLGASSLALLDRCGLLAGVLGLHRYSGRFG